MGGGRKGCSGQSPRAEGLKVALLGWVPCSEGELALCTPPAVLLQGGTCNSTLPLSEAGRGPPWDSSSTEAEPRHCLALAAAIRDSVTRSRG